MRDLLSKNLLSHGLVIGRRDVSGVLETSFVARSRDEVHIVESRTTVVSSPDAVEDHEAGEEGLEEQRRESACERREKVSKSAHDREVRRNEGAGVESNAANMYENVETVEKQDNEAVGD